MGPKLDSDPTLEKKTGFDPPDKSDPGDPKEKPYPGPIFFSKPDLDATKISEILYPNPDPQL